MIYNMYQYLKNELSSTETIKINLKYEQVSDPSLPDRLILIKETGGTETAWFKYKQQEIQVLVRDIDSVRARELAYDIYDLLDNRFGLILPTVTVNSVAYDQLQTAQISANASPASIGEDENGRAEWSTNYRVIYPDN